MVLCVLIQVVVCHSQKHPSQGKVFTIQGKMTLGLSVCTCESCCSYSPFLLKSSWVTPLESSVNGGVMNFNLEVWKRLENWYYLQLARHYVQENMQMKPHNGWIITFVFPVQLTANNEIVCVITSGKMLPFGPPRVLQWALQEYRCKGHNSHSKGLSPSFWGNKPIKGIPGSLW